MDYIESCAGCRHSCHSWHCPPSMYEPCGYPFCVEHTGVAPGEYLVEWMEDHDANVDDVMSALGLTEGQVYGLLEGRFPITAVLASHLEALTKIPAEVWLKYDRSYRGA